MHASGSSGASNFAATYLRVNCTSSIIASMPAHTASSGTISTLSPTVMPESTSGMLRIVTPSGTTDSSNDTIFSTSTSRPVFTVVVGIL